MRARWIGTGIESYEQLTQQGDVGLGAENYHYSVMVRCPVCDDLHIVDHRWTWDQATLTITPSVAVGPWSRADNVEHFCHWNLTNGEFLIHGDTR